MTEPRPAEEFVDLLLMSDEVMTACRADLGSDAEATLAEASKGNPADFLDWFSNWRTEGTEELVHGIEGAAPYNDTFWININRSGPLYWIRAMEFDDECYFATEEDAVQFAESNFESFITELAERRRQGNKED